MRILVIAILTGLLISRSLFSQSTEKWVDVTYIANAGFLIEGGII